MVADGFLRIGAFSRASSLSVKALRSYHDMGLLVPAAVDPATGYRSYAAAQLVEATTIRRLRQLDVPLQAIREVIESGDPAVTRKVLADHGAVLEARLAALLSTVEELHAAVAAYPNDAGVLRRQERAHTVLAVSEVIHPDAISPFLEGAAALLFQAAIDRGAVIDASFGAWYPAQLDDDAQEVTAFLPVVSAPMLGARELSAGVRVAELPATDVAALTHDGSYESLEDAYRQLGFWVAEHARPAELPVREIYEVTPAQTDDPRELRTEICWPIEKERAPQ